MLEISCQNAASDRWPSFRCFFVKFEPGRSQSGTSLRAFFQACLGCLCYTFWKHLCCFLYLSLSSWFPFFRSIWLVAFLQALLLLLSSCPLGCFFLSCFGLRSSYLAFLQAFLLLLLSTCLLCCFQWLAFLIFFIQFLCFFFWLSFKPSRDAGLFLAIASKYGWGFEF